MTPREKKLAALVAVAALVAAADFAMRTASDFSVGAVDEKQEEARLLIAETNAAVAALPMTPEVSRRFAHVVKPLAADPFEKPALSRSLAFSQGEQLPFIRASGFISIGSTRIVIINGEEYQKGDVIPETGEVVRAIDDTGVRLALPEEGTERRLGYEDPLLADDEVLIP